MLISNKVNCVVVILFILAVQGWMNLTFADSSVVIPKHDSESILGYLSESNLPDGISLLPPPPSWDSIAFRVDEEEYRVTRKLRDTPRWTLAIQDANLTFPEVVGSFSCALNAPITEQLTPRIYKLMQSTRIDIKNSINKVKDHYKRARPFSVKKEMSCTPYDEARLIGNGSYPSGHTATSWTWALILTEIAPERANPILARGYAFGYSRVICGVHWWSDVNAGFFIASMVAARLHADPVFRGDLEIAKTELAEVRAKGLKPTRDCQQEAAALSFNSASVTE
ncbi:Acid phosphatase [Gammaproteobacteria bacterium]